MTGDCRIPHIRSSLVSRVDSPYANILGWAVQNESKRPMRCINAWYGPYAYLTLNRAASHSIRITYGAMP
jgi:hypothetical protein